MQLSNSEITVDEVLRLPKGKIEAFGTGRELVFREDDIEWAVSLFNSQAPATERGRRFHSQAELLTYVNNELAISETTYSVAV